MKRLVLFLVMAVLFSSGCSFFVGQDAQRMCFKKACFKVEIAATEETRREGLMYRKYLAPDQGMLFVFDQLGEYAFWMKNTRLSLDMIWLDEDRRVVHMEQNVPVCVSDPCTVYSPLISAQYVLELPAGTVVRQKITLGDVLQMDKER